MMGGQQQSDSSRQMQGFMQGAAGYQAGVDPATKYGADMWYDDSNLMAGVREGWRQSSMMQQPQETGYHEPAAPHTATGPSYEQQLADQQAQYDAQLEEARVAQGITNRDNLYAGYLDAAGSAADYVNSEITKEQANARLLGIDYAITDEQKTTRINDYFSTIWGAGDQQQLDTLMGEFGNPTGFDGYTVTRGEGGTYATQEGEETSVGTSEGIKPTFATAADDEDTLDTESILGA